MPYLLKLLSPVSGEDILTNETTPQYLAINWLAYEDTSGIQLDETNANILIERYVVSLLYFAMGGYDDAWQFDYDFLLNTSVCDWPPSSSAFDESLNGTNGTDYFDDTYIDEDDQEEAIRVNGVRCNSDGSVNQIRFGKFSSSR